jgi:hypothetical protein
MNSFLLVLFLSEAGQCGDIETLGKIYASQPTAVSTSYPHETTVPLHVLPHSQRFHSSGRTRTVDGTLLDPDITPDQNHSIFYPVSQKQWDDLTPKQKQEVLRTRCALVVSEKPYEIDGERLDFNADGLSAFTHLNRLAFVHGTRSRALPYLFANNVI